MAMDAATSTETDEALMALAAGGDQAAFGRLARRHLPRLVTLANRMLGDRAAAEDAAQEALLRAWRHAARYDPGRAKVTTWLHRITVNLVVDRCRAARRPTAMLAEDIVDSQPLAPAAIERRQRHGALAAGIAAMPDRQRAALLLTYAEQRAGAEAAAMLGISTRALEGLLRRGRHFLADWLRASQV
jgi:RNA polymerase sigma-70 factor (ECF subfamily)